MKFSLRFFLLCLALLCVLSVTVFVGRRFGLLLLIGIGFGAVLESCRFGFSGPWRTLIEHRDPGGVIAQFIAIGLTALIAIPVIGMGTGEITGAYAPIGFAMVLGALVFGAAMQIVFGCGSGTLVNAGSGNIVAFIALPFFVIGSFVGSYDLIWWIGLGTLPILTLPDLMGPIEALSVTLLMLIFLGGVLLWKAPPGKRILSRRLLIGAFAISLLAIANLLVSGQPWGVVYGLGLWGGKVAQSVGIDMSGSVFWSAAQQSERLQQSLLTDVTSLTNLGIILGAFIVAFWRQELSLRSPQLPIRAWLAVIGAGFLLGYSARLAFGCNVGAFFSGISTGSLHGWVWFLSALIGCRVGIFLRKRLGFEEDPVR